MIETFRGIWRFAGEEQRNIRRSVIACFFNAVFHMFEIAAIYYTILALLDGKTGSATAWQALGLLAVSILGSAVTSISPSFSRPTPGTSWRPISAWPSGSG